MQVGIELIFGAGPDDTIADCGRVAAMVEGLGFSSMWVPDHVVLFENYEPNYSYTADGQPPVGAHGWIDPLWALAAAAGSTSTLRLGTGILILPQRNPVILAKEIVALDQLSTGRFEFGVGVGWSPEEYAALGVPFEKRGRRADEYLEAMIALWTTTPATYEAEFVSFVGAVALPRPTQKPHPPLWIGGQTPPALRRAAKLGDGWNSWMLAREQMSAAHDEADRQCEAEGRDPGTLRRLHTIAYTDASSFSEYLDEATKLGAEEVVAVPFVPEKPLEGVLSEIAEVSAGR